MTSQIKIKRSGTTAAPNVLASGELAYSWNVGANKLYIGTGTETDGVAANIDAIGGKYYTDIIDGATHDNIVNRLVKRNEFGQFDGILLGTAAAWTTPRNLSLTGDISAVFSNVSGTSDIATSATLATVNNDPGTYGSALAIPSFTVNSKGLITSITAVPISSAVDFNISGNTGTDTVIVGVDTLFFEGSTGVSTVVSNNKVTFSIGQDVGTTSNVTFNDLTLTGNLVVQGTTTTINSIIVEIEDLNVTVAKNAATPAEANGGGLTVKGAEAQLVYIAETDRWRLNKDVEVVSSFKSHYTFAPSADHRAAVFRGSDLYIFRNAPNRAVFKQSGGGGPFDNLNISLSYDVNYAASNGTDVYVSTFGDGIYKQTNGTGNFVPYDLSGQLLQGITFRNTDIYVAVNNGGIFKQTGGVGSFVQVGSSTSSWRQLASDGTDVYAATADGGLFKQSSGFGNFEFVNTGGLIFFGVCIIGNDLFGAAYNGLVYRQINKTGNWIPFTSTGRAWNSLFANSDTQIFGTIQGDTADPLLKASLFPEVIATSSIAKKLENVRNIAATGDASWNVNFDGTSNASATLTLATVNSNVGTFGTSTVIPSIVVNSKGLVTAVAENAIPIATTSVLGLASFNTNNFEVVSGAVSLKSVDGGTY